MAALESIPAAEGVWTHTGVAYDERGGALGVTGRELGDAPRHASAPVLVSLRRVREDALPENIDYEDTGCEAAARCLECPLPRCRYDEPGGLRGLLNRDRDRRIAELRQRRRVPVDELAGRFGVSRRTVFRILKRVAADGDSDADALRRSFGLRLRPNGDT